MEKERYLNQLIDLINVLRAPELDVARKHLQAYDSNHTANSRKMFQLYKYIKINKIAVYDKLKKKVSPNSTEDSFNRLIRRTIDRLQESLIIDVNIRRKDAYSDIFRKKFFLRKQLIEAQIIMGRGLRGRSLNVYNSILRTAKKYELYDEALEALYFKQSITTNTVGNKYFDGLEKQIDYLEQCRFLLRKSQKLRARIISDGIAKQKSSSNLKDFESKVNQIEEYYEKTKSSNIQSIYFLLKLDLEKIKGNPVDRLVEQFILLLESSPAVYSKVRISFLYSELAIAQLNALKFNNAKQSLVKSENGITEGSLVYVIRKIIYLRTLIFLNEFNQFNIVYSQLGKKGVFEKYKLQSSIISFYNSVVFFLLKDYVKCLYDLRVKNEIEKDKEGWNVWIRIMRLLCSIEMLKLNMIDYDIESFRKYLERTSKQFDVRERDKLVLRVLLELDRQDYDFKQTAIEVTDELEKLKSTDKKYAWSPDSPELILFHDWFEAKRLNKDYEPNFEVYREAMKSEQNSDESIP